jgi:hypothetical protein
MFFAYILAKTFANGAIYCSNPYPDLEFNPRAHVEAATNIL